MDSEVPSQKADLILSCTYNTLPPPHTLFITRLQQKDSINRGFLTRLSLVCMQTELTVGERQIVIYPAEQPHTNMSINITICITISIPQNTEI